MSDNKQISVEENNLFCACHLLNCDEGKTEKSEPSRVSNPSNASRKSGDALVFVNIARIHCTSIRHVRWPSTI
jgi:hypothetical protein